MKRCLGKSGVMMFSSTAACALFFLTACEPAPGGTATEASASGTVESRPESGRFAAATSDQNGVAKASDFFEKASDPADPWLAYHGDYLCLWSGVGGDFNGDDIYTDTGESAVDWQDFNYWRLAWREGKSTARAICTNWNNFVAPAGSSKQISEGAQATASGNSNSTAQATAWQGDAVTFLRGVSGEMQSNTEYAEVIQSTTIGGNSILRVHQEEGDVFDWTTLSGFSHSVFVGVPQTRLARLIGFSTASQTFFRGTVNSAGVMEFPVSTVSGFSTHWMSGVHQGVCSFTRIAGNFDGGGEHVRIFQNGGQWFLQASAAAGKGIYAKARCMAYDQR